jgi:anti-sigma regulatory factor (Ser/Thr protein kinase)
VNTRDMLSKTCELRFAPTAGAPCQARAAVKNTLFDRPKETIETASLLVSELVTNSLRHGNAILNASVVLRISQHDGVIRIEVVDWGQGFEYHRRSVPSDPAGGWGLYLVEQLSSRWGIERGTPNVVWFELSESA